MAGVRLGRASVGSQSLASDFLEWWRAHPSIEAGQLVLEVGPLSRRSPGDMAGLQVPGGAAESEVPSPAQGLQDVVFIRRVRHTARSDLSRSVIHQPCPLSRHDSDCGRIREAHCALLVHTGPREWDPRHLQGQAVHRVHKPPTKRKGSTVHVTHATVVFHKLRVSTLTWVITWKWNH